MFFLASFVSEKTNNVMEKKRKRGRPRKEGMINWHLSVKEAEKNKITAELKRLGIADSKHVMNVLDLVDLAQIKDNGDYEKRFVATNLLVKQGRTLNLQDACLFFFDLKKSTVCL